MAINPCALVNVWFRVVAVALRIASGAFAASRRILSKFRHFISIDGTLDSYGISVKSSCREFRYDVVGKAIELLVALSNRDDVLPRFVRRFRTAAELIPHFGLRFEPTGTPCVSPDIFANSVGHRLYAALSSLDLDACDGHTRSSVP